MRAPRKVSEVRLRFSTVIFDLDSSLFVSGAEEVKKLALEQTAELISREGFDKLALLSAMYKAERCLDQCDGSKTCEDALWELEASEVGGRLHLERINAASYWSGDFKELLGLLEPLAYAPGILRGLRKYGRKVVISSDPMFPEAAVTAKLGRLGVDSDAADLTVHSGNSRFGRGREEYYLGICEKLGVSPQECIIIGGGSIIPAAGAGMQAVLVSRASAAFAGEQDAQLYVLNEEYPPQERLFRMFVSQLKGEL